MEGAGYRLAVFVDGEWIPHRYSDVFGLEHPYLVAAPLGSPLSLAVALLDALTPPYSLELEILEPEGLSAREGEVVAIGSYLSFDAASRWLRAHADLLEADARLAVVIQGSQGERIVYDEHNRLLLTGPILDFEGVLISQGLMPGEVAIPMPHAHRYLDSLTPQFANLINR